MKSPITLKSECKLLAKLDPIRIANQWKEVFNINVGFFAGLEKVECWRCIESGFTWYTPPEAAGGAELYQQLERFPWYYLSSKWEFSEALRNIPENSKVIEVGVGDGAFLDAARSQGREAMGIELNPLSAARARNKGFVVLECDVTSLSERGIDAVDAVCAFQVLEHVPRPREFIEGMLSVLKPGGALLLSVPNAKVLSAIDAGGSILDQPPHHMGHWDEGVFRFLENVLPIRLTEIRFEPLAPYHIDWYLSSLVRRSRQHYCSPLGRLLINRLSLPLIRQFLRMGARKFVRGHSILVVFEKLR